MASAHHFRISTYPPRDDRRHRRKRGAWGSGPSYRAACLPPWLGLLCPHFVFCFAKGTKDFLGVEKEGLFSSHTRLCVGWGFAASCTMSTEEVTSAPVVAEQPPPVLASNQPAGGGEAAAETTLTAPPVAQAPAATVAAAEPAQAQQQNRSADTDSVGGYVPPTSLACGLGRLANDWLVCVRL